LREKRSKAFDTWLVDEVRKVIEEFPELWYAADYGDSSGAAP
jgi:hypothetical protein